METKTIRISFAGAKIVKNQATRLGKSQVDWINQAAESSLNRKKFCEESKRNSNEIQ